MPYINAGTVREIRQEIRKQFPKFKFSVTTQNYSEICVAILRGDIDFGTEYQQINHYYYKEHYKEKPLVVNIFRKILNIIEDKKGLKVRNADDPYNRSEPNYYISLQVGKYDKPYELVVAVK